MGGVLVAGGKAHEDAGQFARDGSVRPPWSAEGRIRDACTSCGECIKNCSEAILRPGPAGTPVVDFSVGACTFCAACAEACPEPVFDFDSDPWSLIAHVQSSCLLNAGISCRICTDACDETALRFDLRGGIVGKIHVEAAACTGCGACAGTCPAGAIAFVERRIVRGARP
ncbi:MAG: ferredoxin-type protein NapF [Pseudomonadota bacterium]